MGANPACPTPTIATRSVMGAGSLTKATDSPKATFPGTYNAAGGTKLHPSEPEREVVDAFHRLYYDAASRGGTWANTTWLGVPTEKCPLDLWVYQEILHEVRPDVIVETGTRWGGSALFLASMCDLLRQGRVITIDVDVPGARPNHERITYLLGSSTSQTIVDGVRRQVAGAEHVIVVLDSDHSMS